MSYILGVDGGGSKTEAVIIDRNGVMLGHGLAGGSNTNFIPWREAVASFRYAIQQALHNAQLEPRQICAAGCTFGSAAPNAFAELGIGVKPVGIAEHQVAFERAGLDRVYGVALVAGTGSSCFGFGESGKQFHAGGLGPLLGDEGSGYDIGLRGLRRALLAEKGRRPPTMLSQAVCEYFGVHTASMLVAKLAGPCIRQPLVAGFARKVAECARQGDEAALEIMQYAGRTLGELAIFVASHVFSREDEFPVALAGGVFGAGELVIDPLRSVILEQFPEARLIVARMSPGEAVARLVRKKIISGEDR